MLELAERTVSQEMTRLTNTVKAVFDSLAANSLKCLAVLHCDEVAVLH